MFALELTSASSYRKDFAGESYVTMQASLHGMEKFDCLREKSAGKV
jgi:hypothetical protein